jgi:hypothetical protein
MPTKRRKRTAGSRRKPKAKARSAINEMLAEEIEQEPVVETTEPEEIVVEEKTRIERAPVVIRIPVLLVGHDRLRCSIIRRPATT